MHSRIFQLSTKPIKKEDYIDDSNYAYEHWFTNSIADYVIDSQYRNEDLKWLEDCYENQGIKFGKDDDGEYLIVESKQKYFENSFNKFMETIEKIKSYTIDNFVGGFDEMWHLKNAYEYKYGFYVDVNEELLSFDSFIRYCTTDEKYYIGGTLDYHC